MDIDRLDHTLGDLLTFEKRHRPVGRKHVMQKFLQCFQNRFAFRNPSRVGPKVVDHVPEYRLQLLARLDVQRIIQQLV